MARMRFTIGQRTNLYSAAMVVASVVAAGHLFFKADYLFAQNERLALIEVDASNTDRIETLLAESISETRAIYASPDTLSAAAHVEELNTRIDRVEALLRQWQSANGVADQGLFKALSERIASFNAQRRGLVELARNETPDAVRQLSDAPSSPVRTETEALAVAIRAMSGALHQQFEASSRQVGETITTIKWSVVAACVAWFAFAFGLALPFVQKSVARPIARVSRYMNELADGKTAMDIRTSERNDEVGDMWRSLVRLRGAIERNAELMHELKLRDDREADLMRQAAIRDQARDFHASLISATGRVSALLGEIGGSATKMNEAADFARSRGAEMTNSAQSAEQNIAIVSVSALQVSSSTREISERVEGVATAVRDTLDNAERSVAASADLDIAGKRIGDVVSLISDVAAQTNLLALNATIEAARAGAAGRGFAVVAAEVKALATQTSQATLEIGAQVKDMQAATRLSITAIDGIRTEIRTISEATSAISSAILEQNAAFMQIASTVKAAAEESRTMTMAAGVVGRAIQDTGVRADAMQSIAGALTEEIDRLSTHIAVFSETLSAA